MPFKSIGKFLSDVFDFVVEAVVDVVDEVISWIVPIPEIPEFGDTNQEQQAKGVLVNKLSAKKLFPNFLDKFLIINFALSLLLFFSIFLNSVFFLS